ncbi:CHASE2 domain-containing protein [Chitinimonas koreensis]|uniref:CHASE2 domain-containing protein n=1 Tax=Chitinimonas koreensis TaxID=356302 RepID=UPI001654A12D|nr:CHASE2 domain-containing protein [Chitinimonas koreensis]
MAALFRFFRQFSYWHWLVLVLALVALDYLVLDASRVVDQRAGDLLLRQHAAGRPVSDTVTVIDVDQRSLEEMAAVAGSWPWPRSVHGELVAHLARQKPRAIVFDIMFNEPDVYRPEHDALFADTVAAYPNVYQPLLLSGQGGGAAGAMPPALGFTPLPGASPAARLPVLLPLVLIRHPEAMRGGLINFVEDSDRVGRHYYLYRDHANWRLPALPAGWRATSAGRSRPPTASCSTGAAAGGTSPMPISTPTPSASIRCGRPTSSATASW